MRTKYFAVAVIVISLLSLTVILYAQSQNISKQRTPKLTTDDVNVTHLPPPPGTTDPVATTTPSRNKIEPVQGAIAWQHDLNRALEIARSNNRVVVVDVYTDWCGWCKKMDRDIYTDPMVVGLSRQEVFLKLDAEDGGQGQEFARRMNVRGYPTTIVLDHQGRALKSVAGYLQSPQRFISFVESARNARTN